jgi:Bacterial PH domain
VRKVSDLGEERFALTAAPPVRALAIASVVAIVGAALMVGSRALGLGPFVLAVGATGLGLAVVLAIAAVVLVLRLRSTLVLDRDGITVIRARRTRRLSWSDIESVNLTGPRLTLVSKVSGRADVSVLNLRSQSDPTFISLVRAIQGRLDADRGYRTR